MKTKNLPAKGKWSREEAKDMGYEMDPASQLATGKLAIHKTPPKHIVLTYICSLLDSVSESLWLMPSPSSWASSASPTVSTLAM